jgi:NADPH:quinone reductase-like Zn-dependent oxidoreductase
MSSSLTSRQHKALILSSKDAGLFVVGDRAIPKPGSGQLLIKLLASSLNPVDYYIQKNGYIVEHYGFPAVPGSDGAGIVEDVGEGVEDWKVGDKA